jgi:serine/threonine protein kinase
MGSTGDDLSSPEFTSSDLGSACQLLRLTKKLFPVEDLTYCTNCVLGKGALGAVYSGKLRLADGTTQRVAVKQHYYLPPEKSCVTAAETEALVVRDAVACMRIGARIGSHPNVVELVGAVLYSHGRPVLVYNFIDGINLDDRIEVRTAAFHIQGTLVLTLIVLVVFVCASFKILLLARQGKLASKKKWKPKLSLALTWAEQLFAALDWLHSSKLPVIHRDVKPANILLSGPQLAHLKLIDFDLARFLTVDQDGSVQREDDEEEACKLMELEGRDMTGRIGTYRYMAPEIWQGEKDYGSRVDVYSATLVRCRLCSAM